MPDGSAYPAPVLAVASPLFLATALAAPVITSGPDERSTRSSATFTFTLDSTDRLKRHTCDLGASDRPRPCVSPHTYTDLKPGTYTFTVRSLDDGASDSYTWTIVGIDDDGDGHFLPADCDDANPAIHPGAEDVPGNGVDEDCSGADAPIVVLVPQPSPSPAPTPTPTSTPRPTAKPKLAFTLNYFMRASKRSTRFTTLSVKGVPRGATVTVTCTGGCPRRSQTFRNKRGTFALTGYRHRAIRAGAKLTIKVTRPGSIGMSKIIRIRAGKRPTISTKTLR